MTQESLIGAVEVAKMLGVSARVLDGWRLRGQGPPFIRLTARSVRYRRGDVEAWVAARRVNGHVAQEQA